MFKLSKKIICLTVAALSVAGAVALSQYSYAAPPDNYIKAVTPMVLEEKSGGASGSHVRYYRLMDNKIGNLANMNGLVYSYIPTLVDIISNKLTYCRYDIAINFYENDNFDINSDKLSDSASFMEYEANWVNGVYEGCGSALYNDTKNIVINEFSGLYSYFYKSSDGMTIKSTSTDRSVEYEKLNKDKFPVGSGLESGDEVYVEKDVPVGSCPTAIVRWNSEPKNWAFLAARVNHEVVENDGAKRYRSIMSAAGYSSDNLMNCYVGINGHDEKVVHEDELGRVALASRSDLWKFDVSTCSGKDKWHNFREINHGNGKDNVYCLGQWAVGGSKNGVFNSGEAQMPSPTSSSAKQDPEEGEEGVTSSCAVDGVGWIVCPVMNFMGKLTDGMFGFISSALSVDSGLVKTDSGTYRGWQIMRNFANAGLVIVFIIIIMSQLTSMGISNYGVKKMLPRLVIAAILINVSFFIAQLAVDLSNMLGFSLKSVFESAAVFNDAWAGQNLIGDVVGQILAGGAIGALGVGAAVLSVGSAFYFGGVGLLIVILLSGLLAVAVLFLIITARMALIVVLVVVAPLAFLAMVLPNTKSWFDKWSKLFISLLVVFPMLSVLFGASKMASNIIIQNAVSSSGDDTSTIMLIIGIGVALVPLFAAIPIVKSSLNTVPVLGKMASRINGFRPGRAAMSKGVKASREGLSGMTKNAALAGRFGKFGKSMAAGGARRTRRAQNVQGEIARSEAELLANQTLSDSGATDRQKASAYASLSKLEDEEIAAIQSLDKRNNMSNEDHLNRLSSDDPKISSAQRIASIRAVSKAGGQGDKNNLARLSSLAHLSEGERAEIAEQTAIGMGAKNPAFGGISIAEISKGSFNSDNAYARYAASNDFTAESFVSMHDNARSEMLASLSTKSADSASTKGMARVLEQYENASDDFKAKVNPAVIEALRKSIETSQANITPTLNVPVATQDSTSSQGDPGGTQFNVPR